MVVRGRKGAAREGGREEGGRERGERKEVVEIREKKERGGGIKRAHSILSLNARYI